MSLAVPSAKTPRAPIAPQGRYTGTVRAVEEPAPENAQQYVVTWAFTHDETDWELPQLCDQAGFLETLVDLGLGGQTVKPGDAVGRQATVRVAHYASHRYARVADTEPLDA
ncbi:MAG: hypothetical protein OXI57_11155 [Rhodospirillales bacterium]|nr:hypothetical protein [Rhodospirillales bacterium]